MLRLSWILSFFFCLSAQALDLRSQAVEKRNSLSMSGQSSEFILDEGTSKGKEVTIKGTGLQVGFSHSLNEMFSLDVFLSTALNSDQGVSSSFTGYGGGVYYNLWGHCCEKSRTTVVNGVPVFTETTEMNHILQVGVRLNQFLLNGSKGVYSSSGLGYSGNYLFRLFGWRFKASYESSEMVSGKTKVQGSFISFGMVFNL